VAGFTSLSCPPPRIPIDQDAIRAFCVRHGVRRLALYGSVLRSDFTETSDVDVLVEFHPGRAPGYFGLSAMQDELCRMFGRRVDLRTPGELSRYFREDVVRQAETQYAQA
jgi:predicted nucleotidyltransferase